MLRRLVLEPPPNLTAGFSRRSLRELLSALGVANSLRHLSMEESRALLDLFTKSAADYLDGCISRANSSNADYPAYHSGALANYTDSYWSRNTETESVSNRLRKNPGFKEVAAGQSLTTGPTGVTHHLRILKCGAHIEVEVNGRVALQWDDPDPPLGAGRIGLRSMEGVTMVAYDHFKVWRVERK